MSQPWDISIASSPGGPVRLAGKATGEPSGGSTPGAARWLGPFTFAYNTAGLAAGIDIFTPAVGDLLVDAVVQIPTAFNGSTPQLDFGYLAAVEAAGGFFYRQNAAVPLGVADYTGAPEYTYGQAVGGLLSQAGIVYNATDQSTLFGAVPYRLLSATALSLWASQDGQPGSAAVGGSAGVGRLYICIATPSLT